MGRQSAVASSPEARSCAPNLFGDYIGYLHSVGGGVRFKLVDTYEVELVALRQVAPRSAAQGARRRLCQSTAARCCAGELSQRDNFYPVAVGCSGLFTTFNHTQSEGGGL